MTTHLIIPDAHAHPEHHNKRAEWLSKLIMDVKPDVVVNMGDGADMASLCSYDKGKRSFHGRSYKRDIDAHLDFQDRLWTPFRKAKKRRPYSIYLIGNHEQRIERALDLSPELQGTIGYKDLDLDRNYDEVVEYEGSAPGTVIVDDILYAHFLPSGVMGRPIGGEHLAYSLINKCHISATVGHSHILDYCIRAKQGTEEKLMGLSAGVFQDYIAGWPGPAERLWWRGVVIKRDVEKGQYNPEFINIDTLGTVYG